MSDLSKYDEDCKEIMFRHGALGVAVIVVGGEKGPGFAVATLDPKFVEQLPKMLRHVADAIEAGDSETETEAIRLPA